MRRGPYRLPDGRAGARPPKAEGRASGETVPDTLLRRVGARDRPRDRGAASRSGSGTPAGGRSSWSRTSTTSSCWARASRSSTRSLWEIGHVAWFQEKWVLRHAARAAAAPRRRRRALRLERRRRTTRAGTCRCRRATETLAYMRRRCATRVLERLARGADAERDAYFVLLVRLPRGHARRGVHLHAPDARLPGAAPRTARRRRRPAPRPAAPRAGRRRGPRRHASCSAPTPGEPFVFDNEKWAHPVDGARRSRIAGAGDAGGVRRVRRRRRLPPARALERRRLGWREAAGADAPASTGGASGGGWLRRDFDRWVPLEPHRPDASTSTGTRPRPTAAGRPAAADRGRVGGGGVASRRPAAGERSGASRGATSRRRRSAPTSTAGRWAASTSARSPRATAPSAAGR